MEDWAALRWIILACALLVAPVSAAWDGWTYHLLTTEGVEATAVVTGKTRSSRRSTTYTIEYRFRDTAGGVRSGSQRVGYKAYAGLAYGQRIPIVYSRSNPDFSAAYLDVLRERVATFSLVSLLLGICAGSATWWWAYALRKTREHDAAMGSLPA
jgi:hypothetical protein